MQNESASEEIRNMSANPILRNTLKAENGKTR